MKNVKHMTPQANNQQPSSSPEAEWVDEWVPLSKVIQHGPLQVRHKLDPSALKRYSDMTKAGSIAPPIKLGRVGDRLYLVDGWHRLAVGAVEKTEMMAAVLEVRALVKTMTEDQVRWEAAKANLGHGVPLKAREYRGVFRAFIRAKQHHLEKGKFMSYRDMAAALGVGVAHTTLRNWTMADFPSLARALGGDDHGNPSASQPTIGMTMEEEHVQEAQKALQQLEQHAVLMSCPAARWKLLQGLQATSAALEAAGAMQPEPELF